MTDDKNDDCRWAWDTAPADGSLSGPVYIGDKEDWSLEETRKRRDTNREPWGGVWTEPLTPGAKKAKWGKTTFDSGRYRCCDDLHDCGVFVAVKQGPVMAWHFQRQWNFGENNSNDSNRFECRNESKYKGPSRFHNIVVNEVHSLLKQMTEFTGKDIVEIKKETTVAKLDSFEPDVHVRFSDETWFAIEVVLTSAPERPKHNKFGTNLVEINLNVLDCLENDRDFSRWVQQGGVSELLHAEVTLEQRTQRWNARDKKWKRKDEREFRAAFELEFSRCQEKFGFTIPDKNLELIHDIMEIERVFADEEKRLEQLERIKKAIERNVIKYGERLPLGPADFTLVKHVDEYYREELGETLNEKKKKEVEFRDYRIEISKELGPDFVNNYATFEELLEAVEALKRIEDLEQRMRSEHEKKANELTKKLDSVIKNLTAESEIVLALKDLITVSIMTPIPIRTHFTTVGVDGYTSAGKHKHRESHHSVSAYLQEVDLICNRKEETHSCFLVDYTSIEDVCVKTLLEISSRFLEHRKIFLDSYEWLDDLRLELAELENKKDFDEVWRNVSKVTDHLWRDFPPLGGYRRTRKSQWLLENMNIKKRIKHMEVIERIIHLGIDTQRNTPLINDDFWQKAGIAELFIGLDLDKVWPRWLLQKEEREKARRAEAERAEAERAEAERAEAKRAKAEREDRMAEIRRKSEEYSENVKAERKAEAKKYQPQRSNKRSTYEEFEKDKKSYYKMKKSLTKEANNSHIPPKRKREAREKLDKLIKQNGKKFGDEDAE